VGRAWVAGEISNLRVAHSGHVYFTLKDETAQIRAALFRGAAERIAFTPEDGLEVLAYGEVTLYEPRGDLQLLVRQLEPRGRGALQLAFEQLRRRLEREGLFAPERKRALPALPRRIGVVTSLAGAALHDVLQVTRRRLAGVPILVSPARVQGEGAEADLVAALRALDAHGGVDVILLVRGGGSLEDLLAFNGEALARAIVASRAPVVTGVGHETDFTIADFAADARAPTPSAAAALVLPDGSDLEARRLALGRRLLAAARRRLERAWSRLDRDREGLRAVSPRARLAARRERLEVLRRDLERAARLRCEAARGRLGGLAGRLESLSPLAVLARGYAIVRRVADGAVVRAPEDVAADEALAIRVARGEIAARAEGSQPRRPGTRTR
jgi:exodeoxyribonuclease VII large subunit